MNTFVFTKKAEKTFRKLPEDAQERIIKKLKELHAHPDIFSVLKNLHNFEPATHRLRIGSYRLILELQTQKPPKFWVLEVGDRREVYRQ
jgi:mRNA-degrading endonuclease RelE of RelBE toxin-antitoxin system